MLMYNVCRSLSQIGGSKKTKYRVPKVASQLQPFSCFFTKFKLLGNCSPPSLSTHAVTPKSLTLKGSAWPPKHLVSYISLATPLKKSQKRSCSHLKNILFNIWKFAGTLSKLGCPKILKLWRWAVSIIMRARQRNSLVLVIPPRKLLPLKFWKRNKRFSRLHLLPNTHFIPKPGMFCQNLLSWNRSFFPII